MKGILETQARLAALAPQGDNVFMEPAWRNSMGLIRT